MQILNRILYVNNQNAKPQAQRVIGEKLVDLLSFKYVDMPAGKHIFVKELEHNFICNVSVPQYIATHQSSTPVIRTEFCKLQDIGLVSYKSLYTII